MALSLVQQLGNRCPCSRGIGSSLWCCSLAGSRKYDTVDDSLDIAESDEEESNDDGGDQFEIGSDNRPRNSAMVPNGETLDLLPWPLCNTSLLFSNVPRRFAGSKTQ
jgi:hypothetical protein